MTIHPHPQGSEEWHEARRAKITGTRSKGLFVPSDTLLFELAVEYTGDELEPVYETYQMTRGTELQPLAMAELSKAIDVEFKEVGFCLDESLPILGVSPDGLSECQTVMCEIKCPGAKKHIQTCLEDDIPSDNIHQCLHYFTVNPKLEKLYFCSYRPEQKLRPLFFKLLTRESMVNLGTKATPKMYTVTKAVEIARKEAISINKQLNEAVDKLKF